jgi:hypothetical protein
MTEVGDTLKRTQRMTGAGNLRDGGKTVTDLKTMAEYKPLKRYASSSRKVDVWLTLASPGISGFLKVHLRQKYYHPPHLLHPEPCRQVMSQGEPRQIQLRVNVSGKLEIQLLLKTLLKVEAYGHGSVTRNPDSLKLRSTLTGLNSHAKTTTEIAVERGQYLVRSVHIDISKSNLTFRRPDREKDINDIPSALGPEQATQPPKRPRIVRNRYSASSSSYAVAKRSLPIDPQAGDKTRSGRKD